MSKTEFTPGPWDISPINPIVHCGESVSVNEISSSRYFWLAMVATDTGAGNHEGEFNAILISKAPDLYDRVEELTDALSIWEGEGTLPKEWEKLLSDAVDTLREARGEK